MVWTAIGVGLGIDKVSNLTSETLRQMYKIQLLTLAGSRMKQADVELPVDHSASCLLRGFFQSGMNHFIRHGVDARHVLHWKNIFLPPCLMDTAIDDDDVQSFMVLKDCDVLQRVPIDHNTIGEVALFDLAHLVRAHEQLGYAVSCCNDGFVWSEPKALNKMCKVARISAVRCPSESIITCIS